MHSGITVQQVLRRKYGIVVVQVKTDDGYVSQVLHNGSVIFETPDDCLATASLVNTGKIWKAIAPPTVLQYDFTPAYAYLAGRNVMSAMQEFDLNRFEVDLLPHLVEAGTLDKQLQVYRENREQVDETSTYFLYDVLVRLLCYAREHGIQATRKGVQGYVITQPDVALTTPDAECIDVTDRPELLVALKIVHAGAVEYKEEDRIYLIKDTPLSTYACAKGTVHREIPGTFLADLAEKKVSPLVRPVVASGAVDVDYKDKIVQLVAGILGQGGQPRTPEEKDLFDYNRVVCGVGKPVGKNALAGLGSVVSEGPLAERLDALYVALCRKIGGLLKPTDIYKLAASRIANMNSAKIIVIENDGLCIKNRVFGSEMITQFV